ncbi:DUF6527 family protein [Metapseudomonas resinovorans]|uniref:Ammonia monooxygenase n=1 Tax=Metapseudomonas resinovorans NBRC 106553 TaxID=1245471 RepID=S6AV34_METRE|nr:DUF6527 family protein [Pseudomonas resinovorans]BAN48281.1 hypothetical protein PCA10_25490 [Pseudomonas resinovorans NBRC 106553]
MSGFTRLSAVLEDADGKLFFGCPGCNMLHGLNVLNGLKPDWTWNGDAEKPKFSPSVLVTYRWGPEQAEVRCHSFAREGRIEFFSDCTHALAGKTVDLPSVEDY